MKRLPCFTFEVVGWVKWTNGHFLDSFDHKSRKIFLVKVKHKGFSTHTHTLNLRSWKIGFILEASREDI